ncbi:MAG TPA: formate dehydrogenase accessory sulfurtransferase FdhD [Polyangia bacterium]|nr:formate dehydrogenase accessory sulfurtransferase FdhD [Polyangia bacterium]
MRAVERPVERRGTPRAFTGDRPADRDLVVAEEPLEIRIGGESLMVTMRTPGDDLDLTAGLLFTEGVIASLAEIESLAHARENGSGAENIVDVTAAGGHALAVGAARRVLRATAACGLCGKESIAAVRRRVPRITDDLRVPLGRVLAMPAAIRAEQQVFEATGGLHAVGLFDQDGALLLVREDVGRHNAVDKVIGARLRGGAACFARTVMFLSGRAGFELVQKAAVAGVPVVCSVSAPSALAVDLAQEAGVTLVGFVRGGSANVYTHPHRIA